MNARAAKIATILALAAIAACWFFLPRMEMPAFNDPQQLGEWIMAWDTLAPAAIVFLQAAQVLLAPIPGHALGIASGYLFGTWWGTVYSMAGTLAGSLVALLLARRYGRPIVARLVSREALEWLDARAGQHGLLFFVLVFLLPFLPDDVACLIAGLSPIPVPALMLAMLAGRTPGVFASVWIGANAASLSTAQIVGAIAAGVAVALTFLLFEARLQAAAMDLVDRLSG